MEVERKRQLMGKVILITDPKLTQGQNGKGK
jgi:hypothetical protein